MVQNSDSIKSISVKTDTSHVKKSVGKSVSNVKKTTSKDITVEKSQQTNTAPGNAVKNQNTAASETASKIPSPSSPVSATSTTFSLQSGIDSAFLKDSVNSAIIVKDTTAVILPTGKTGAPIKHIVGNTSWIFILIVVLFALLMGTLSKSVKILKEYIKTFFGGNSSYYSFDVNTILPFDTRVFSIPFVIGTISLFIFEYICNKNIEPTFSLFIKTTVVVMAFYIIKYLMLKMVSYVFFDSNRTKYYINVYNILLLLTSIVLFPFVILLTYHPDNLVISIDFTALIIIIFFFILLIIKLFVTFYTKLLDFIYFLLYLCILEILPLFVLFRVLNLMI